MKLGCHNIKGMVLVSPVDGVDPFGLLDDFCITPGEMLPFDVPTLVISAGYDSTPGLDVGGDILPSCAPEELSNARFYNALNGEVWLNNATEFGHVDFMDPEWIPSVAAIIHACAVTTQETTEEYLKMVPGQALALFSGLLGECEMFKYLRDNSLIPTNTEVMSKGDTNLPNCPTASCHF